MKAQIIGNIFSGFYEGHAIFYISQEIEQLFEEDDKEADFNWLGSAMYTYAKAFVKGYDKEVSNNTGNITFADLYTPKEYNFESDTIIVDIKDELAAHIVLTVFTEHFDCLAVELLQQFTPCDGFYPNYSNDVDDWKNLTCNKMDEIQLGIFLKVYQENTIIGLDECTIMESAICNGLIQELVNEQNPNL